MFLNISTLVRQPKARKGAVAVVEDEGESIVEEVSKEQALLMAGAELEGTDLMDGLEYDEDVTAWAEAIALWMQQRGGNPVGFMEVLDGVEYPVVKGWLAVLLGGFELKQDGEFYDKSGIVIRLG